MTLLLTAFADRPASGEESGDAADIRIWLSYRTPEGRERLLQGKFIQVRDGKFEFGYEGTTITVPSDRLVRLRFGEKPEWWKSRKKDHLAHAGHRRGQGPLSEPASGRRKLPEDRPKPDQPRHGPEFKSKNPPDAPHRRPKPSMEDIRRNRIEMQSFMRAMHAKKKDGKLDEFLTDLETKLAGMDDHAKAAKALKELFSGLLVQSQSGVLKKEAIGPRLHKAVEGVANKRLRARLLIELRVIGARLKEMKDNTDRFKGRQPRDRRPRWRRGPPGRKGDEGTDGTGHDRRRRRGRP